MSYDLSFERRHLWSLGVMIPLCAVLLVAAGYFAGRLAGPTLVAAIPVSAGAPTAKMLEVKRPELPVLAKKDDAQGTPKPEASGEAAASSSPAEASVTGNAAVPAPGEIPSAALLLAAPASAAAVKADAAPVSAVKADAVPTRRAGYTLQFGIFAERGGAKALADELNSRGLEARVAVVPNEAGESIATVRYGSYGTLALAVHAANAQAVALDRNVVVRPLGRL